MKTYIFLIIFMLVLPSQLTGITTTHHDKPEILHPEKQEELSPASTGRINITERQRRLIPYMTFYLTRNLNRPSNQLQELREPPQQFQVLPQKVTIQPYHGNIILVNDNQQKYEHQNNQPILVYQPKTTYTPFQESNKLPGGFTPMRNPGVQTQQPIRVQVINPNVHQENNQQPLTTKEPNYSLIYDKLLQLKHLQYNKPPQYRPVQLQPPERPDRLERPDRPDRPEIPDRFERQKINVAAQYFRNYATPRPPTKYITLENYPPEQEYKPASLKTIPTKYITLDYPGDRPETRYKTPAPIKTAPKYITIAGLQSDVYNSPPPIKSPLKYITLENYQPEVQQERYKTPTPTKTYIHTYTPANIDISNENKIQNYENFESLKTYNQIPAPEKEYEPAPVQQIQQVPQVQHIPQIQVQTIAPIRQYSKPDYESQTQNPILLPPVYHSYPPVYEQGTSSPPAYTATDNPHSLSVILKQLQESNTLPQTLTPDNIDNSIKTLVHILNALKQTQKFQNPIVVAPDDSTQQEHLDEYDDDIPETVSQAFPAETPEGGTPGKPGIDYPAYSIIPQTDFNCKKQRYKGFFGDPDTNCQVWHYCDLNGGQASFLCPNGTIFSQVALTCDWWYNVKCATTTQLYVLNERLYKYILPFTPKFPEDYSGPLVDRYLALKFKEMEEKMKKQKKGKTEKPTDDIQDSAVNKLEDDIDEETVAESQPQEHTTQLNQEKISIK